MFVGAAGVGRMVQRTVELMQEHDTDDIGPTAASTWPPCQRYLNLHYSVSLDLFGAETSTNAANYYAAGLKGRFQEAARRRPPAARRHPRRPVRVDGRLGEREAPALAALNETLRDDYVADCRKGLDRWNRTLAAVGCELVLPHPGFHRAVGEFAAHHVSPDGRLLSEEEGRPACRIGFPPTRTVPTSSRSWSACTSRGGWRAGSRPRRRASTRSR